jgi:glycosyltransferase involved in cell wall biosynthesis
MQDSAAEPTTPPPFVSVITATYNWSSVLRYAIQSVLWQTLQDFEMLIIGDGCTDDSAEVVASLHDPRLRWHNLQENSGHQSVPNNTGLAMARGKYVAYLGHDDLWYPTHMAGLVNELEKTNADIANSVCLMIGPPGSRVRRLVGGTFHTGTSKWMPPSCVMHKRSLVSEIGYWKKYTELHVGPEDDFFYRAELNGSSFVIVKNVTAFKFPSAWRPDSYRERRCDEQAEYARRIQTEPDFLEREIIDTAVAYEQGKILYTGGPWRDLKKPRFTPPGWDIEQFRRVRGLDPRPLAPLTALQRTLLFLYPFTFPIRKIRRAVMRLAQRGS